MIKNFRNKKQNLITIIGIGGGSQNIVNYLNERIENINFISINSDEQVLNLAETKALLLTDKKAFLLNKNKFLLFWKNLFNKVFAKKQSLGCGGDINRGKYLAEKHVKKISKIARFADSKVVILVSTFGGGFGTGVTPVIAKHLKTLNINTIAIITLPFSFEGKTRKMTAQKGIDELIPYVQNCIVLDNEKLTHNMPANITTKEMFNSINEVFYTNILQVISNGGI